MTAVMEPPTASASDADSSSLADAVKLVNESRKDWRRGQGISREVLAAEVLVFEHALRRRALRAINENYVTRKRAQEWLDAANLGPLPVRHAYKAVYEWPYPNVHNYTQIYYTVDAYSEGEAMTHFLECVTHDFDSARAVYGVLCTPNPDRGQRPAAPSPTSVEKF